MSHLFALDIGTNSIGYAVFEQNSAQRPTELVDGGTVIFSDSRNQKNSTSLAARRLAKRLQRRQIERRKKRRSHFWNRAIEFGLVDPSITEQEKLKGLDPYELRLRAKNEKLSPPELARCLFHFTVRRGFLSNRKTNRKSNEDGKVLESIKATSSKMSELGVKTFGEFLYLRKSKKDPIRNRRESYQFCITRQEIENEFNLIRSIQGNTYLTEDQWDQLKHIIFFQRPIIPPRPGRCTIFYDESRYPKASVLYESFRIASDVANLAIIDKYGKAKEIPIQLKQKILSDLNLKKEISFDKLSKLIGLLDGERFNLESERRKKLKGHSINSFYMHDPKLSQFWKNIPNFERNEIYEILINAENTVDAKKILSEHIADESIIDSLVSTSLPYEDDGYGTYSKKALVLILEEMEKQIVNVNRILSNLNLIRKKPKVERLEYYAKQMPHTAYCFPHSKDSNDAYYGRIGNPTVHVALIQLQKLINALIDKYGKPNLIRIELYRDLKHPKKIRNEISAYQARQQKENERIGERLKALDQRISPANIERYKLWEELGETQQERRCVYTGTLIPETEIFSSKFEVEHIIPFKRSLDNSFKNKTLSTVKSNRDKLDKTPFEAFSGTKGYDYQAIIERASKLSRDKRKRFASSEEEDIKKVEGFLARQSTDTAYISKIALEYLSSLAKTESVNGCLTNFLRRQWGLMSAIGQENKERDKDHRHHLIDACVIGLTSQDLRKFVTTFQGQKIKVDCPIPNLNEQLASLAKRKVVYHKPDHGAEGELFEETLYGPLELNGNQVSIRRKALDLCKSKEILNKKLPTIKDDWLRNNLSQILENSGISGVKHFFEENQIFKVRTVENANCLLFKKNDKLGREHHYCLKSAENHSLVVWSVPSHFLVNYDEIKNPYCYILKNKRLKDYFVFHTKRFNEAASLNEFKPHPGAKKILNICKNDYIWIKKQSEKPYLALVTKLDPTNNRIYLNLPNVPNKGAKYESLSYGNFLKFDIRKAHVDILGSVKVGANQFGAS